MSYELILGEYAYSSWSLRGWLLFEKFGLERRTRFVNFATKDVAAQLSDVPPAQTVPTLITPEGAVVSDSLAIAEELASRHPEAGHWPADPKARAIARTLCAEMHSSFSALRKQCPMGLSKAYNWQTPSPEVLADVSRIETLWQYARETCHPSGPWLCGEYSVVDAFFAPIAGRIAGFSLPVRAQAQAYIDAHLADPAFRRWRAMGNAANKVLDWYEQPHPVVSWPGPEPLPAKATSRTDSENDACPYSGDPVTDFLELDGRVFGFCNPFCREKTVADPAAWPAFMALVTPSP